MLCAHFSLHMLLRSARLVARQVAILAAVCAIVVYLCAGVHSNAGNTPLGKHALLLTAHPDDECMFFAPTVLAHPNISALCLSTGNADGLGGIRAKELTRSYSALGVPPEHVFHVDDPCVHA